MSLISEWLRRLRDKRDMKRLKKHVLEAKAKMPEPIRSAHKHSSQHRSEIESSDVCGCFYCGKTFPPSEIQEWVDDGKTAMCPKCGIDSVLGSASGYPFTKEFLDEMNQYWFQATWTLKSHRVK